MCHCATVLLQTTTTASVAGLLSTTVAPEAITADCENPGLGTIHCHCADPCNTWLGQLFNVFLPRKAAMLARCGGS